MEIFVVTRIEKLCIDYYSNITGVGSWWPSWGKVNIVAGKHQAISRTNVDQRSWRHVSSWTILSCAYKQERMSQHNSDIIMRAMASQITGVSIVCSTVCSSADQNKFEPPRHWPLRRGNHQRPMDSPNKGPVTQKMLPFADIDMELYMTY